jgi:hypothetical protein
MIFLQWDRRRKLTQEAQLCSIMCHNGVDNDGQLLHAVAQYCKVVQEGAPEHIFNDTLQDSHEGGGAVAVEGQANRDAEIRTNLNGGGEDASNFQALGFLLMMTMTRLRRAFLLHQMPLTWSASTWSGTVFLWMHKDFVELLM